MRAGVTGGVLGRDGGAGEDELARKTAGVDLPAHKVPQRGLDLPLIYESRHAASQEERRIDLQGGADLRQPRVQCDLGGGVLPPGHGLAASADALDEDAARVAERVVDEPVHDPRQITLLLHLPLPSAWPHGADPARGASAVIHLAPFQSSTWRHCNRSSGVVPVIHMASFQSFTWRRSLRCLPGPRGPVARTGSTPPRPGSGCAAPAWPGSS